MKRAIFAGVILAAVAGGLAACSPPRAPETRADPGPTSGWTRSPAILAVRRGPATLIFSGQAQPRARVVLRNDSGAAYAAAADDQGRFEIRMAVPQGALLLRPETQIGQNAVASPDRLLIIDGGRGPIAVLRPGGPTQRLDAAPPLGAIDSDGRAVMASGRTADGRARVPVVAGDETLEVTSDRSGRWSVMLDPAAPTDVLRVSGQTYAWPGTGGAPGPLQVERAGEGWRVGWTGPAGARQWTWMPDAAA